MRKFQVLSTHGCDPVDVYADDATWGDGILRFKVGEQIVAVFFQPIWFMEVTNSEQKLKVA